MGLGLLPKYGFSYKKAFDERDTSFFEEIENFHISHESANLTYTFDFSSMIWVYEGETFFMGNGLVPSNVLKLAVREAFIKILASGTIPADYCNVADWEEGLIFQVIS
jgi:hypothetical protein